MTSTDWTVYNDGTKRTQYSTKPTSDITVETVVVDGFALLQKDTVGITTSASRCFTASGMVLTQTDSLLAGGKTHLITETRDALGRSTGYTYAKDGSTQQTVTTGYGADGRIATAGFLHGGVERQFSYEYLSGTNLLQKLTLPSNMTLTQSYEPQRDLLTSMLYKRGSTAVAQRSYSYDALGRPLTRSTARNRQTINDSFGYNTRSELTSATVNNGSYAYDYDNIGNRKTAQENDEEIIGYQANALNQYAMLSVDDIADFIPSYDAAGNQTRVKTSTGIWAISYDAENRPTDFTSQAVDGTITIVHCEYDYMGRRATKKVTVNGSVTLHQRFLYRGYLQIACCDLTRSNHPCLWLITWDPSQPVATRPLAIQKDGTWYTYGWDLTKNVCEVYGQHGYIRTNYSYSPYGTVTEEGDITQPIQWSSELNDAELGLVYYNYRHYNPVEGRWIGKDTLPVLFSYVYCKNAPSTLIDVLGNKETNISLLLQYLSFFRDKEYYDTDDFGLTEDIRKIIDNKVIPNVVLQINKKVQGLIEEQSKYYGAEKTTYSTSNSYDFSSVLWALGSGVVRTYSDITYAWKKLYCTRRTATIGFSWDALIFIKYTDIFRDIFDIEGWIGLPVEVGNDYHYSHEWLDVIKGEGLALILR